MREKIMAALEFPRLLIRGDLELQDCTHSGHYARDHRSCQDCIQGAECEWLCSNDEFVALGEKPLEELGEALEFALGYVDAQITLWGHVRQSCRCDACDWLRGSQRLFNSLVASDWRGESPHAVGIG